MIKYKRWNKLGSDGMKKYFQFKKEEKAVLAIGMLVIVVVLAAGLLKQKFVKVP